MAGRQYPLGGMADHVVWDWNGTLWDDLPQVHLAVNAALGEVGVDPLGLSEYITLFARPLSVFYGRVLGRGITDSEWERVNHTFLMSYQSNLHRVRLAAEAPRALEMVAQSGATQSILSLYPHVSLNSLVRELGIAHYFTRIDGLRGAPGRSKVGLFGDHVRAAAAAGIPPQRVVMIGDTDDDLTAAREAGISCILVNHHGNHPLGDPTLGRFFADGLLAALEKAGLRSQDARIALGVNPSHPQGSTRTAGNAG